MDIIVKLETLPRVGMHFLQIQNPDGMFSNDFIFYVTEEKMAEKRTTDKNKAYITHLILYAVPNSQLTGIPPKPEGLGLLPED